MNDTGYLILAALAAGPRHGYGIIKDVAELSGGEVTLGAGTLYGSLSRFVEEELVAVERAEVVSGRPRKYYVLTTEGSTRLAAETARRTELAQRIQQLLGRSGYEQT